jgi:hypothetical protein
VPGPHLSSKTQTSSLRIVPAPHSVFGVSSVGVSSVTCSSTVGSTGVSSTIGSSMGSVTDEPN